MTTNIRQTWKNVILTLTNNFGRDIDFAMNFRINDREVSTDFFGVIPAGKKFTKTYSPPGYLPGLNVGDKVVAELVERTVGHLEWSNTLTYKESPPPPVESLLPAVASAIAGAMAVIWGLS